MSLHVHVARIIPVQVLATGAIKTNNSMTIGEKCTANTEFRVMADTAIPNSAGYPTIKAYIEAEAASGYKVSHIDQTMIISYDG